MKDLPPISEQLVLLYHEAEDLPPALRPFARRVVQLMASMWGVERCEILADILERQRRKAKT